MELAVVNNLIKSKLTDKQLEVLRPHLNLTEAAVNEPYIIKGVDPADNNVKEFLFTLGCYEGVTITVISILAENYVINVKDARYSIDEDLAKAILV